MLTKDKVNIQIDSMPNEFTLDDLIEKLLVVEKGEIGLDQIKSGNTISEDELDKRMEVWST
jgi:hypothetical protein